MTESKTTHAYLTPGLTSTAAVTEQAIERRNKDGRSTWIHHHKYLLPCNEECKLISPNIEEK